MKKKVTDVSRSHKISPQLSKESIHISITNQHGKRHRFEAQAVSLTMQKGVLQILQNDRGYFVWFKRCNIEMRYAHRTWLLRLKNGTASILHATTLAVLAEISNTTTKGAVRSHRTTPANVQSHSLLKQYQNHEH